MISGIFFFEFKANNNDYGQGLAVIEDGIVNGGDPSYLYRGKFDAYGDKVKALIIVSHYRGARNSVMGDLKEFSLQLEGTFTNNTIDISGGIQEHPQLSIRIIGKKVATLHPK